MRFLSPLLILVALLAAACGGAAVLPDEFTRERADGKIPVSIPLIREQTEKEIDGMPEGQAKVERWQVIEKDHNACRLSSSRKTKAEADKVFADCMSRKGYVYMYRLDAEQLHGDIASKMFSEKSATERAAKEAQIASQKKYQQDKKNSSLRIAVFNGNVDVARSWLARGANPNAADADSTTALADGTTALMIAAKKGYAEIAKMLLDADANPNLQSKKGATALMFAAGHGHAEIAKMLLTAGVNPNVVAADLTALMIAISADHVEIAKVLLDAAAGANPNLAQKDGYTALMMAAQKGHAELAKMLLDAGAFPNAKKDNGHTALMMAADNGDAEIAKMLLAAGANPNAQRDSGWTALMRAAVRGDAEIAKMLLTVGANPNAIHNSSGTALFHAVIKGHTEIVKILLAGGAFPNWISKKGFTALIFAIITDKAEIVKVLLACGASPDIKDKKSGETAWDIAKERPLILPILEEYKAAIEAGGKPKSCVAKRQPQQPKKPAAKAKETVYNQQQGGNMNNSTQKTISQKLQEKHDAIAARSDHSHIEELEQKVGRAIFTWIFTMQNLDKMIVWLGGEGGGRKDNSRISKFKKLCRKCPDQGMVCGYKELCKNLEITLEKRGSIAHDLPSLVFTGRLHKKIVKGKEIYHLQSDLKKMREMKDKFSSIQKAYSQVLNFSLQMPQGKRVLEKFYNDLPPIPTDES